MRQGKANDGALNLSKLTFIITILFQWLRIYGEVFARVNIIETAESIVIGRLQIQKYYTALDVMT